MTQGRTRRRLCAQLKSSHKLLGVQRAVVLRNQQPSSHDTLDETFAPARLPDPRDQKSRCPRYGETGCWQVVNEQRVVDEEHMSFCH